MCMTIDNEVEIMCDEKEVEIWATLQILDKKSKKEILLIKSDCTTEMLCDTVLEDLFGRLFYYRNIDFTSCESKIIININIFGEYFPVMDINRVYLKLLSKINAEVIYNMNFLRTKHSN